MVIFLALLFSAVGLTTAVLVVVNKVAMNGALFLVVTLFAVAASYILLGAEFMAAVQIIVYAGAIMVLIMFVIQLVGFQSTKEGLIQKQAPLAIIVVTLLFVQIAFFTTRSLNVIASEAREVVIPAPFGQAPVGRSIGRHRAVGEAKAGIQGLDSR